MTAKKNKYNLKQFNQELNELYVLLQEENYTAQELKDFFRPITKRMKKSYAVAVYYFLSAFISISMFIYFLTYFDYFYWHLSAIGRILMIKILPYFDWRYLKNEQCLIPPKFGLFKKVPKEVYFNCDLCENLNKLDVYEAIDEDILTQAYINLHVPLILTKGIEHWTQQKNLIENLISDETFFYSEPCKLSTNIYDGVTFSGKILERTTMFQSFFLHFQNCDLEGMKAFRKFVYRPDYLPDIYSPILFNWLIWNKNYNTTNYKNIDLVEKVTIFGQIAGKSYVRLTPRKNCEFSCPILNFPLTQGESVIFTSLWDLSYKPNGEGENLATILETRD